MPGELVEFTPFGYLRNPGHVARSWADTRGGNLRAAPDVVGVEWVYPVGRDARARCGLAVAVEHEGETYATRAAFAALGLTSRYHTALLLGFDFLVDRIEVALRFFLVSEDALCLRATVRNGAGERRALTLRVARQGDTDEALRSPHVVSAETFGAPMALAAGEEHILFARLKRGAAIADGAGADVEEVYARLLEEDAAFAARCPTLTGDWPADWAEGLHHDFQTTRLLVQPAGGIFRDVWPSWMAAWPRVVLAEGILDMVRLAYADPALAQRAVLSLFRDAPQPNVPCVFRGGEYNMVAADGSRCGTSPAWCLPFVHLELLFLRTLDRVWLADIFPFAAAYLRWWLANRTDADGWLVYKCTWESGEDGNPRLDPTGSGDADISHRVRPVELQATMAHAANVMAFFATELGQSAAEWCALEADFRERTRQLFDPAEGRYRDWLVADGRFQEPCPERPYWGVDSRRYGAQSLTPLLIGEPLAADEVWRHAVAPWTLWPSWTTSLVESAAAAGHFASIGTLAHDTLDRVYRVTTRRDLATLAKPLPGSAPEFWPADWRTYDGNDAYGWGASTANLLLRHLVGFKESRLTDGWVAELTPALPAVLLEHGARYTVRQIGYRGLSLDLTYVVEADGVSVELDLLGEARAGALQPVGGDPGLPVQRSTRGVRHVFSVEVGGHYRLRFE